MTTLFLKELLQAKTAFERVVKATIHFDQAELFEGIGEVFQDALHDFYATERDLNEKYGLDRPFRKGATEEETAALMKEREENQKLVHATLKKLMEETDITHHHVPIPRSKLRGQVPPFGIQVLDLILLVSIGIIAKEEKPVGRE